MSFRGKHAGHAWCYLFEGQLLFWVNFLIGPQANCNFIFILWHIFVYNFEKSAESVRQRNTKKTIILHGWLWWAKRWQGLFRFQNCWEGSYQPSEPLFLITTCQTVWGLNQKTSEEVWFKYSTTCKISIASSLIYNFLAVVFYYRKINTLSFNFGTFIYFPNHSTL